MAVIVSDGKGKIDLFDRLIKDLQVLEARIEIKIPYLFFFKIEYFDMFHSVSLLSKTQFLFLIDKLCLLLACRCSWELLVYCWIYHTNCNIIIELLWYNLVSFSILNAYYLYVMSICPYPAPMWNLVRKINGPYLLKFLSFHNFCTPFAYAAKMDK